MKYLEWHFEERTTFFGSIAPIDNSFDHDFGTKKITDYEVVDFEVLVWIGGDWESVKIMHKAMEDYYKEKFLEWAVTTQLIAS